MKPTDKPNLNMSRTLLACAVFFLGAAVRCRGDAYNVDRHRGGVALDDVDAGKGAAASALPSVEMGRKRL